MATLPDFTGRLARNLDRAMDKLREAEIENHLQAETIRRLRADADGMEIANRQMHADKARALQALEGARAENARLRRLLEDAGVTP